MTVMTSTMTEAAHLGMCLSNLARSGCTTITSATDSITGATMWFAALMPPDHDHDRGCGDEQERRPGRSHGQGVTHWARSRGAPLQFSPVPQRLEHAHEVPVQLVAAHDRLGRGEQV